MYLLDTNIISELRRGSPPPVNWLRSVSGSYFWLSVISLGELKRGIAIRARKDAAAADILDAWLQHLRFEYAGHILPVTDEISLEWGRISALRTRGVPDCLIAATAIVHKLTLVTRNVADFGDLGLPLVNPWDWTSS